MLKSTVITRRVGSCVRVYAAKDMGKYIHLTPKNAKQAKYIELLRGEKPEIVVATGSAGTGKTLLAAHVGVQKLLSQEVKKIVITRPAVSVDEQHGFLPGSLEKKMEPWVRPIYDVLNMHFPRSKIDNMIKDQVIEICPLAFMRGRTFDNAWIICDESQNTTPNQMLMVLTRIGKNSKVVIAGDPNQYDRGFNNNGLSDLLQKLEYQHGMEDRWIDVVEFGEEDVERNPVIPHILSLYK